MTTTTTLGPSQLKKLEKDIDNAYGRCMSGIQVNMMNLSKVSAHVKKCVLEGKTIEEGYAEAKDLYREN